MTTFQHHSSLCGAEGKLFRTAWRSGAKLFPDIWDQLYSYSICTDGKCMPKKATRTNLLFGHPIEVNKVTLWKTLIYITLVCYIALLQEFGPTAHQTNCLPEKAWTKFILTSKKWVNITFISVCFQSLYKILEH